MDGFEMREVHRLLLARSRTYLLHNLRPTEMFWSTLMAKDIFSDDMIEEIKSSRIRSEQIGRMLDLLPARGPSAFELFCESLLECDHPHVAEYLKTVEATDNFRTEVARHCTVSDGMLDQFVSIYKHHTPSIKRFAEQKYEKLLEEQGRDFEECEKERQKQQNRCAMLELENSQLKGFIGTFHGFSEDVNREIQNKYISKTFLRETYKYLETLKGELKNESSLDKISEFYSNMQALLAFLENHSNGIGKDSPIVENTTKNNNQRSGRPYSALKRIGSAFDGTGSGTMKEKLELVLKNLSSVIHTIGSRTYVTAALIKKDIEQVFLKFKEIMEDVFYVKDVFKTTLRQKRKLEGELVSLVHNWQETRRLEREVKEKQGHISELNKEGNVLRKKTRGQQHRKQLEQIQHNVEQKRSQLRDLQRALERHLGSADVRVHALLGLLPDLDDGDRVGRGDTEILSDAASMASRVPTPVSSNHPQPASSESALNGRNKENVNSVSTNSRKIEDSSRPKPEPSVSVPEQTVKPDAVGSMNNAQKKPEKAISRLLERRYIQQQRSSRLANPNSRSRDVYMHGQLNKGATMKYTPRQSTQPHRDNKAAPGQSERLTTVVQNIINKQKADEQPEKATQKVAPDPPKEKPKPDPIDQWLAQQTKQSKADQLQKKVANFKVVEGEDRTEEIRKLGRTLERSRPASAQLPQSSSQLEENISNNQGDQPEAGNHLPMNQQGPPVQGMDNDQGKSNGSTPSPLPKRPRSNSYSTPVQNGLQSQSHLHSKAIVTPSTAAPTPTQQTSQSTSNGSDSRENSGGSGESRTKNNSPPGRADSRAAVSVSVMAGDLMGASVFKSMPHVRQSTSMIPENPDNQYQKRSQAQGQRQLVSTNKVNLSLPPF